jgi:hypothetical protein
VLTINGIFYLHHELIEVIFEKFISTVACASVSLLNLIVLEPKISVDNGISVIVLVGLVIIIGVDGTIGALV